MAHILVVDDEFGISRLLEEVLQDEGHTVAVASNGRQGFESAQLKIPDLVLSDLMMPIMDGPALVAALKADATFASIPIILMSALPEESVAEQCSDYTKFVRKPFKLFQLVELITDLALPKHQNKSSENALGENE